MKWHRFFLVAVFSVVLSGCLWPFRWKTPSPPTNASAFSVFVEVLRPDVLAKGGELVFVPFTAGENAEAGPRLDRLALMILKGSLETFQNSSGTVQMIDDSDPDKADMILEGRIEDLRGSGGWKMFGIGKRNGVMAIKGEVRSRRTNQILALISGRKEFRRDRDAEAVAYDIGRSIAEQLTQHESRP